MLTIINQYYLFIVNYHVLNNNNFVLIITDYYYKYKITGIVNN